MKRISLECAHCHENDFEVAYVSGSCDKSWQIEIICENCGRLTLLAVTQEYQPKLDCVNEPRWPYYPTEKLEGGT